MKFLIIKTSAIGDIIQSFVVVKYLKRRWPGCGVDWVVEEGNGFVRGYPLVDGVLLFNFWTIFKFLRELRRVEYEAVFDIQGNIKSALFTLFARSRNKVGFAISCVQEWPNVLVTNRRYKVDLRDSIRKQYLSLLYQYFGEVDSGQKFEKVRLRSSGVDFEWLSCIDKKKFLIAPFSKKENKQMRTNDLISFLKLIEKKYDPCFLFLSDGSGQRKVVEKLSRDLSCCKLLEKMEIATVQHIISKVDLLIAVDSFALHLAEDTDTRVFSIFGPSSLDVYNIEGGGGYQGFCGIHFEKRCKHINSCLNPVCIKGIDINRLFNKFVEFYN